MFRITIPCAVLLALLIGWAGPAAGQEAQTNQAEAPASEARTPKVLFLLAEGFNRQEFWTPYLAIQAAGYSVDVAAPEAGTVRLSDKKPHPQDAEANLSLKQVRVEDYLGLVIPGGYSPGNLEKHPEAIEIVRAFFQASKPVAGICHGPRLLMRAGLLEDRVTTCLFAVKDELADAWSAGKYGKYVDAPVVVDGNLITSRYPQDSPAFSRAFLEQLAERDGGLEIPNAPARAMLVATGTTPHIRWIFREIPPILATDVQLVAESNLAEIATQAKAGEYGALVVVDGPGFRKLADNEDFRTLAKRFSQADVPLVAVNEAAELLEKMEIQPDRKVRGRFPEMISVLASVPQRKDPGPAELPADAAWIRLSKGFSGRQYAAVSALLDLAGKKPIAVGEQGGWVRSAEGYPVHVRAVMPRMPAAEKMIEIRGEQVSLGSHDELGDRLQAALSEGEGKPTAVLALRAGFDGLTAEAIRAALRSRGHRVRVIGPETGPMKGLNGMVLEVDGTYASAGDLPADMIIAAPGSFWPAKTDKARQAEQPAWLDGQAEKDQARRNWMLEKYDRGATLLLFGTDSLQIGRQERFKGKKFSTTEQARWSFGKSGGKFSGDPARLSAERLISAKGLSAVGEAVELLDQVGSQE